MTATPPQQPHVVVITGASSGIGRAVAHRLAASGHRLVLTSRSAEVLADVAAECVRNGARPQDVATFAADVRDAAAVERLFDEAEARFGPVDRVVQSAGAMAYGAFADLPAEVFDATIATNLGGTANVARSAVRRFRSRGSGHLVVLSSVLGKITAPKMSAYVASKWAINGLVRSLQVELRNQPGVDVTLVSPGGVDTPIYRQSGTYTGRNGKPPPPVVSATRTAEVIAGVLDRPRTEVPVGLPLEGAVLGFRVAPRWFDALVGPLFDRLAQSRQDGVAPTPGNVFEPRPAGEAVSGGYGRWGSEPEEGPDMDNTSAAEAGHPREPGPTLSRAIAAPAASVWAVLADGWSYANWVVGTARIRAVDPAWPASGAKVHHSFGLWPALIQDFTRVQECQPERELVLVARGWPAGEARVHLSIRPTGENSCEVTITEDAVSGPAKFIPAPVRHLLLTPRNRETLHRLALLAEGHYREQSAATA